jgi:O-antigen/teichoic acid export membrane protein
VILAVGIIIVARLLGPSSYGLYTLTLVIPTLLVALSDAGMNLALVRLPAKLRAEGDYERAKRLIKLGFLLKLAISIAAFFICYAGSTMIATTVLNRPELAPFLQLASLIIIFQAIFDATNNSLIGQDLMQYSASVQIMQATLKGTLGPALVLIGLGVLGAVSGYVLALAVSGLASATILFTKHARSLKHTSGSVSMELRELLSYGLPLYLAAILLAFLTQYQSILLAHFASNTEIGNFNAAWNFNMLFVILTYPMAMAMFPMFSKMDTENQSGELARAFKLTVRYCSLIMIPASVAVMLFSKELVYLTYGSGYVYAPQYLIVLSALYLLTGIGYLVLGNFLNGVAEIETAVKMSVLTLGVYLPLGPALAWPWGPYGLLVAYILSYAIAMVYGIRRISAKLDARPDLRASGRILLAALGAAVPTVGLVQLDGAGIGAVNLVVGGILYLAVYLTLAPILGAVDKSDIMNLETVLCKMRIAATLARPVLDYETSLLSAMRRDRSRD